MFKKAYSLKIVFIIISIMLLFRSLLYASVFLEDNLRLTIGTEDDTYERLLLAEAKVKIEEGKLEEAEELILKLDRYLEETQKSKENIWPIIQNLVQHLPSSNLHRHAAGSLSVESLAGFYRQHPMAVKQFQEEVGLSINPQNPDDLKRMILENQFEHFEASFKLSRYILDNDPDFEFHRKWFRQLIIESSSDGNRFVGIRATLGGHWRISEDFQKAVTAAVEGILEGEESVGYRTRGVLFLSIPKTVSHEKAKWMLNQWLMLRRRWDSENPDYAVRLYGVDSVGEEKSLDPSVHASIFEEAHDAGQYVVYHIAEQWNAGELLTALSRLNDVIESGIISRLSNPVALFVDPMTLRHDFYPKEKCEEIERMQKSILEKIAAYSIVVEISPTSNDLRTQWLRQEEGWKFVPLKYLIDRHISIVVTDDDALLYDTHYLEELKRLYFGTTSYGYVDLRHLLDIVRNSQLKSGL